MTCKKRAVTYCDHCGEEVREDEQLYYWDDEWECPECFEDGAKDYINDMTAEQLADLLYVKRRVVAC